jgi:hypothetical protein
MRYFFDTEFYERGPAHPITLISIGIVAEDGREFYVENSDVDLNSLSPWLKENVVPHLERSKPADPMPERPSFGASDTLIAPHKDIGQGILRFLGTDVKPEFWAYFADYDWVVLCQLYGSMIGLPPTFPHFCLDLKQEMWKRKMHKPTLVGVNAGPEHNALADARWNKALFEYMEKTK